MTKHTNRLAKVSKQNEKNKRKKKYVKKKENKYEFIESKLIIDDITVTKKSKKQMQQ